MSYDNVQTAKVGGQVRQARLRRVVVWTPVGNTGVVGVDTGKRGNQNGRKKR